MIAFNNMLPHEINDKIKCFKGKADEFTWSDIEVKNVTLKFVSQKNICCHGMSNYFKLDDGTLYEKYKKQMNYMPIWETESKEYMLRVPVSKTDNSNKLKRQCYYSADLKMSRYSDYRVDEGKGKCYRAELLNIQIQGQPEEDCGFLD